MLNRKLTFRVFWHATVRRQRVDGRWYFFYLQAPINQARCSVFLDCLILADEVHSKRRQLLALPSDTASHPRRHQSSTERLRQLKFWYKVASVEAILYASHYCRDFRYSQPLLQGLPLQPATTAGTSATASHLLFETECRNTWAKEPRWLSRYDCMDWMDSSPLIGTYPVCMTVRTGWTAVHCLVQVMQLVTNFTVFSRYFHLLTFKHLPGHSVLEHSQPWKCLYLEHGSTEAPRNVWKHTPSVTSDLLCRAQTRPASTAYVWTAR